MLGVDLPQSFDQAHQVVVCVQTYAAFKGLEISEQPDLLVKHLAQRKSHLTALHHIASAKLSLGLEVDGPLESFLA